MQVATFSIESCSPQGIRFDDGGDSFFVCIRSTGTRFRARITDNNDGSYVCNYKPTISGRCSIAVSLFGEPLPGSPFSIVVSSPAPNPSHCILQTPELKPLSGFDWKVVTHAPQIFVISFRDERGNVTHGAELDVYAHRTRNSSPEPSQSTPPRNPQGTPGRVLSPRAESLRAVSPGRIGSPRRVGSPRRNGVGGVPPPLGDNGVRITSPLRLELNHLLHEKEDSLGGLGADLKGMNDFENLVVGEHPLSVTKSKNPDSDQIGQLPSGHVLRLTRLEVVVPKPPLPKSPKSPKSPGSMASDGADASGEQSIEAQETTLRACVVYQEPNPSKESWRDLYNAEQDWRTFSWREHAEELEASSKRSVSTNRTNRSNAGINRNVKGSRGGARKKIEAKGRAKPSSSTPSTPKGSDRDMPVTADVHLSAVAEETEDDATIAIVTAPAPAPALAAVPESSSGTSAPAPAPSLDPANASELPMEPAAQPVPAPKEKSRKSRGPQDEQSQKKKAKSEAEAKAAAEKAAEEKAEEEATEAQRILADRSALMIQRHERARSGRLIGNGLREARRETQEAIRAEAEAKASSTADAALTREIARLLRQQKKAPLTPGIPLKMGKSRGPTFGWVTISLANGESLVHKQMGMLPAHVRREQMAIWQRRYAIDSARERERASFRDEDVEAMCLDELAELARNAKSSGADERALEAAAGKPASGTSSAPSPIQKKSPQSNLVYPTHQTKELLFARSAPKLHGAPPLKQETKTAAEEDPGSKVQSPSNLKLPKKAPRQDEPGAHLTPPKLRMPIPKMPKEAPRIPRAAYLEELEADPRGTGFAYGGMTARSTTERGKPVEAYNVNFSFGVSGTYLMHVGLRSTSSPLAGSPFLITVLPGPAHPLSTMILPSDVDNGAIRGYLQKKGANSSLTSTMMGLFGKKDTATNKDGKDSDALNAAGQAPAKGSTTKGHAEVINNGELMSSEESCAIKLFARDKMGNLCVEGGAVVSCGLLGTEDYEAVCEDRSDGTYVMRWWMHDPGTYKLYVKIDGIHVLGSPVTAVIEADKAESDAAAERRRRRGGVGKREDAAAKEAAAAAAQFLAAEEARLAQVAVKEAELAKIEVERVRTEQEQVAEYRAKQAAAKVMASHPVRVFSPMCGVTRANAPASAVATFPTL